MHIRNRDLRPDWLKYYCLLLAATVLSLTASAAEPQALFLSLDKEGGVYTSGQEARLTIQIAPHIVAEEGWTGEVFWQRGWNPPVGKQSLPLGPSPVEIIFANEAPGLLVVTVSLKKEDADKPVHSESIGMLFDPESITLSTPEAEDFDAFWEEAKAVWRNLVEEITLTPVDSPDPSIEVWDVQIQLSGEIPVSGYIGRPTGAREGTLPALLSLHGAGYRSSNMGAVIRFARMGFLAMDINAHGFPNAMPDSFYKEQAERISGFRTDHADSRNEWYFKGMFLRVVMAMDYLMERKEWNKQDLVLYGSSQGGAQVIAGAALNPAVTVIAASVPAMCDLSGPLADRRGGWPRLLPERHNNRIQAQRIYDTYRYYDSGIFAKRIHAAAIISLGLIDPTCPADGIQATANHLPGEVKLLYRPRMAHSFPHEIQLNFFDFIRDRVTFPQ